MRANEKKIVKENVGLSKNKKMIGEKKNKKRKLKKNENENDN